jgi:hypothetical protein
MGRSRPVHISPAADTGVARRPTTPPPRHSPGGPMWVTVRLPLPGRRPQRECPHSQPESIRGHRARAVPPVPPVEACACLGCSTGTGRVTRWRNDEMALRWAAVAALESERNSRRIIGHEHLWMLRAALDDGRPAREGANPIDAGRVAALATREGPPNLPLPAGHDHTRSRLSFSPESLTIRIKQAGRSHGRGRLRGAVLGVQSPAATGWHGQPMPSRIAAFRLRLSDAATEGRSHRTVRGPSRSSRSWRRPVCCAGHP